MYFIHVYIYILNPKKKNQDSQIFPKREENFQMKKVFGLRALGPWVILKINFFEVGALDFLVAFSKRSIFFSFKDFKIL